MPVSIIISGDGVYATIASPSFTGSPLTPTQTAGDSSLKIANTSFVSNAVAVVAASVASLATSTAATYAPLASPALTGNPTAPTQTAGDNTTRLATTAFVTAATAAVSATVTSLSASVAATYAPLASPALTGNPTAPTQASADNSTKIATTAFVATAAATVGATVTALSTSVAATYAPLASPALTGNPTAPTQTAGNNSTRLATTAFVAATATVLSNAIAAVGLDADPLASLTIDTSAVRAKIDDDGAGSLRLRVRPSAAADDSSYIPALIINDATGQITFPQGVASGDRTGFRNRLRNANFSINQRAVTGTVTLAAGAYGHDGVKAGASGATYTFAVSGLDTTLTVTAGSLILPIESSFIEGGSYTLSQAGTAQARVWQGTGTSSSGSYAAAPFTVTGLTAATQTNVEFTTGTILLPQFEPGLIDTVFERRTPGFELILSMRYFLSTYTSGVAPGTAGASNAFSVFAQTAITYLVVFSGFFPVPMRATPTITIYSPNSGAAGYVYANNNGTDQPAYVSGNSRYGATISLNGVTVTAGFQLNFVASAEI